ncbi:hypothetical protein EGR_07559 [Echinococcus granulosus]|uniref:F-box domain-containing protein n=1 Tax=Echinococcus granulosus TaxID=6210 RepID=W6U8I1_ECHGR|nr:hypothetical protein EGR_07559 [Echinococcus granulosus]EUB57548.1 hypothetical protein EGR_07559 [Echinococcus granulosus]
MDCILQVTEVTYHSKLCSESGILFKIMTAMICLLLCLRWNMFNNIVYVGRRCLASSFIIVGAASLMAQRSSQAKSNDLPPDIKLKICEYLGDRDLINLGQSLPSWRCIFSSLPLSGIIYQHIDQWPWLDKRLCQLLFPRPSPTTFQNAFEAIRYQKEQTASYSRFLNSLAAKHDYGNVHFCIMPTRKSFLESRLAHKALSISKRKNTTLSKLKWSMLRPYGILSYYFRDSDYKNGKPLYNDTPDTHERNDCIVYLMEYSRMFNSELISTLESLEPHQILIIVLVINSRRDKSSQVECFVKFLLSYEIPVLSFLLTVNSESQARIGSLLALELMVFLHSWFSLLADAFLMRRPNSKVVRFSGCWKTNETIEYDELSAP